MPSSKVVSIASVVRLQAKNSAGEWRDLTEGSLIYSGEEIRAQADGEQFGLAAYTLQRRSSGSWVNALTITLDLAEGASHYRHDRFGINGNNTNSTVARTVTIAKGQELLRDLNTTLQANEQSRFTLNAGTTLYRCDASALSFGNRLELGGFEQDFNGTIIADREQFEGGEVTPARGDDVTIGGQTFRAEKVTRDEISYAIDLASVNR